MPDTQNASSGCIKFSKKQKFVFFHILDSIFLLAIQLAQGAVLNYYIIKHFGQWSYLLHGLDIVCALVFLVAQYSAYQYLLYCIENNEYPGKNYAASPKRILSHFPTSKLGVLPLGYVSWIVYVIILLVKIQIIFGVDLFVILNEHDSFAPQLLKVSCYFVLIIMYYFFHYATLIREVKNLRGLQFKRNNLL